MRLIRMIGLAAMSAIAAMAFLGTAAASASTTDLALCATDGLTCASPLKHVHETDSAVTLLTSITTITCSGLFLGDVLTAGALASKGKPLAISGTFSYSGCKTGSGASCEAVELGGPANIEVKKTATEETAVTGEGEVLVDCTSTPHCVYNGENLKGTGYGALLKGPNGEVVTENAVTNQVSGFFCPQTSELDALYKALSATYISS